MQHITELTRNRGTNEPLLPGFVLTGEDPIISMIETVSALGRSEHFIIEVILNCSPDNDPISKTRYDNGNYTKMDETRNIF